MVQIKHSRSVPNQTRCYKSVIMNPCSIIAHHPQQQFQLATGGPQALEYRNHPFSASFQAKLAVAETTGFLQICACGGILCISIFSQRVKSRDGIFQAKFLSQIGNQQVVVGQSHRPKKKESAQVQQSQVSLLSTQQQGQWRGKWPAGRECAAMAFRANPIMQMKAVLIGHCLTLGGAWISRAIALWYQVIVNLIVLVQSRDPLFILWTGRSQYFLLWYHWARLRTRVHCGKSLIDTRFFFGFPIVVCMFQESFLFKL